MRYGLWGFWLRVEDIPKPYIGGSLSFFHDPPKIPSILYPYITPLIPVVSIFFPVIPVSARRRFEVQGLGPRACFFLRSGYAILGLRFNADYGSGQRVQLRRIGLGFRVQAFLVCCRE